MSHRVARLPHASLHPWDSYIPYPPPTEVSSMEDLELGGHVERTWGQLWGVVRRHWHFGRGLDE